MTAAFAVAVRLSFSPNENMTCIEDTQDIMPKLHCTRTETDMSKACLRRWQSNTEDTAKKMLRRTMQREVLLLLGGAAANSDGVI